MGKTPDVILRCSWCKQLFGLKYSRWLDRIRLGKDPIELTCSVACAARKNGYKHDVAKYGKRPV